MTAAWHEFAAWLFFEDVTPLELVGAFALFTLLYSRGRR